jgi:chromosome partitioning protein
VLYTSQQMAEQVGLSADTIRRMDKRGEFKPSHATPGGQRRYTEEDVMRFLETRRRATGGSRCRAISFINVKGGVGKTTLCITLAGALAQKGYHVLVVDVDPQANATQGLGLDPYDLPQTMAQVMLPDGERDKIAITDVIRPLPDLHPHLFLAPGHLDLARADQLLTLHRVQRELVLDEALRSTANEYDFIFIDSPPTLSNLLSNAMCASDGIIIPIDAQYALRGVEMLDQERRICDKVSPHAVTLLGAVLNKQMLATNLHTSVRRETQLLFDGNVFETIIPYRTEIEKSPGYRPVVFGASPVAGPYYDLATELLRRLSAAGDPTGPATASEADGAMERS